MSKYENYLQTYAGRELLKQHSLDDTGTWEVLGEDPNCDLGGHHYQPRLGIYQGKLRDILEMATEMSGFWAWGAGGNINPVAVQKVDAESVKNRNRLIKLEAELKKQLEEVQAKLKAKP